MYRELLLPAALALLVGAGPGCAPAGDQSAGASSADDAETVPGPGADAGPDLSVGDRAPDWALRGSDGAVHRVSDLRGRYVVLAFFPKAFTGG